MSERIIREGIQKLGISPSDPDYIQLLTLIRNIVTDVKQGRITLVDVERFFRESRDAVETMMLSKNINTPVDDVIKQLIDIVKTASLCSGSTLLDMYLKMYKGVSRGKREEEFEEEEKTDTII